MNDMVFNIFWEFLIILLEIALFYIFISAKLSLRKTGTIIHISQFAYLFFQAVITYFCNYLELPTLFTVILSLMLDVVFALIFYKETYFSSIFYCCIYSAICIVAEYLTMAIPQLVSSMPIEKLLAGGKLRVPFTLLYVSLIAVFVFLFINIFSKKIWLSMGQKITYTLLSIIGIGMSHYILIVTIDIANKTYVEPPLDSLITMNLFFLVMFLALLVYIYQLGKSKENNIQLLEREKQFKLEEQQYRILLDTTNTLREIKHDIKHHLDVIQVLANQGNLNKLLEYVTAYDTSLKETNYLLSTGNTAIDCVVSSKLGLMKQCNIDIDYSIMAPAQFPVDDISLTSLLGNILDNAIEGCIRSREENAEFKPWIKFFIKPFQNMVIIHCENNYIGKIQKDSSEKIISSKKNSNHGYGLKRISDIVTENEGILHSLLEDNIFTIHIIIPLKENSYED